MPTLKLIKAPGMTGPGQTYQLNANGHEIVMGREEICNIVVPNHAVSRKHARIYHTQGQFFIEDLKSRNKTIVNNREITEPCVLRHEDRIKICDFQYLYQDDPKPISSQPKLPAEFGRMVDPNETHDSDAPSETSSIEHVLQAKGSEADLILGQPSDRLRALLDISVSLSKPADLESLLGAIADTSFGVFRQADRCFIILAEEKRLVAKVTKTRRKSDSDTASFSKTIVRKCMESQTAYLSEDASSDSAMGAAQSIAEFRIRSVMCVPLLGTDGTSIGAMQLDTQDRGKKFKQDDLKLLMIIANLAGVAIDKARLQETKLLREKLLNEIEIARKVQLDFLPREMPKIPGYEFFAAYNAALTVGGDYYTFIELPDGRIASLLGDVAGKGVPAALLMAKLSAEARYCMLTQADVPAAIKTLSDSLIRGGIGDRFVTMAALVLNPKSHRVTIVNAGHLNPMRYRVRDRSLVEVVSNEQSGLALGIIEDYPYELVEVDLEPGDILLTFTDGVTDAMSPQDVMFNYDGVTAALTHDTPKGPITRPKTLGESLFNAVRKHANGRPQYDDIAIVAFGRLGEGEDDEPDTMPQPKQDTGPHKKYP
jgi:sigma-B regulation protein RsbU (phosphoserine phosphatase)